MRRLLLVLLLGILTGCDDEDPVLDPFRQSLEAYDQGRKALAAGDAEAARKAFARARALDPQSPLPLAWEAHALEAAGRDAEALALLDEGVQRWPASPDLRYNRAALRSRAGNLDGAAEDLLVVYQAGLVLPQEAAKDPDFAPLAASPAHARLVPPPAVEVQARPEEGAVLLGETWDLELQLLAPADAALHLRRVGQPSGLLQLEEVVEEELGVEAGNEARLLRLRWRAVQPGTGTEGPWEIQAGPARGIVDAVPAEVVALPGREPSPLRELPPEIPVPSALGAIDPAPRIETRDQQVVITAPPEARLVLLGPDGAPLPSIRLELRQEQRTVLQRFVVPAGTGGRVRMSRAGTELLDAALP